jgi:hypothetical protein
MLAGEAAGSATLLAADAADVDSASNNNAVRYKFLYGMVNIPLMD